MNYHNNAFLKDKKILITGISGYLGSHLLKELIKYKVHSIRGISRNESKIVELKEEITDNRVRYYIGDIRDIHRMQKAVEGVDIIYHCAALKHISLCETNSFEATYTNIVATQYLIDLAIQNNVRIFVGIDTDKSVGGTLNYYGSTKKVMRQLIINANFIKGNHPCKFFCVRWGNILNSSGSVLPKWKTSIKHNNTIKITDPTMTRFNLDIKDVIDFSLECQDKAIGGEIYIPQMKSYVLEDLAKAVINKYGNKDTKIIIIGNQGYEKIHEELIDIGEYDRIFDIEKGYVVLPDSKYINEYGLKYTVTKKAIFDHKYSSNEANKLSIQELEAMI
jgi:UDP-N-acetylglucosamine 4,6-dehydratase/5-epimerase